MRIAIGERVPFDGEFGEITEIADGSARLKMDSGRRLKVSAYALMNGLKTEAVDDNEPVEEAAEESKPEEAAPIEEASETVKEEQAQPQTNEGPQARTNEGKPARKNAPKPQKPAPPSA